MSSSLVSVVMIFLNPRPFIREAIESVQRQTYPHWELILVDDGSTDGSADIVEEMLAQDPARIRLLRHADGGNHGTAASRNLGIKAARGEFIAFLDADDLYDDNRLQRHLVLFQRYPEAVMVQSLLTYLHSWDGSGAADQPEDPLFVANVTLAPPPNLLMLLVSSNGATCPGCSAYTVRASTMARVGGIDAAFRDAYEDQVLLSKLYLQGPVLCTREYLSWYRQHDASLLHRMGRAGLYGSGRRHPSRRAFLNWLDRYLALEAPHAKQLRKRVKHWLRMESSVLARLTGDWRNVVPPLIRTLAEGVFPRAVTRPLVDWWGARKHRHARRRVHLLGTQIGLATDPGTDLRPRNAAPAAPRGKGDDHAL